MYKYWNSIENRIERLDFFNEKCMLKVMKCDMLNEREKQGNEILMIYMC